MPSGWWRAVGLRLCGRVGGDADGSGGARDDDAPLVVPPPTTTAATANDSTAASAAKSGEIPEDISLWVEEGEACTSTGCQTGWSFADDLQEDEMRRLHAAVDAGMQALSQAEAPIVVEASDARGALEAERLARMHAEDALRVAEVEARGQAALLAALRAENEELKAQVVSLDGRVWWLVKETECHVDGTRVIPGPRSTPPSGRKGERPELSPSPLGSRSPQKAQPKRRPTRSSKLRGNPRKAPAACSPVRPGNGAMASRKRESAT